MEHVVFVHKVIYKDCVLPVYVEGHDYSSQQPISIAITFLGFTLRLCYSTQSKNAS